jgi:hypothetical protein
MLWKANPLWNAVFQNPDSNSIPLFFALAECSMLTFAKNHFQNITLEFQVDVSEFLSLGNQLYLSIPFRFWLDRRKSKKAMRE